MSVAETTFIDAEPSPSRVPGRLPGVTRDAYTLDLCQFATWCQNHNLRLFEVRRADIEC